MCAAARLLCGKLRVLGAHGRDQLVEGELRACLAAAARLHLVRLRLRLRLRLTLTLTLTLTQAVAVTLTLTPTLTVTLTRWRRESAAEWQGMLIAYEISSWFERLQAEGLYPLR